MEAIIRELFGTGVGLLSLGTILFVVLIAGFIAVGVVRSMREPAS